MSQAEALAGALCAQLGVKGNYKAVCPGHEDSSRSLYFMEQGGVIFLHCFGGCPVEHLRTELIEWGLSPVAKVEPYSPQVWIEFDDPLVGKFGAFFENPTARLVGLYPFTDANGTLIGFKTRFSSGPATTFEYLGYNNSKSRKIDLPPYRWPQTLEAVQEGRPVHIFDQEECADKATTIGLPATCLGAIRDRLPGRELAAFAGGKCVIWPTQDKTAVERAHRVAAMLHNLGVTVKVAIVPVGRDFVEWKFTMNDLKELLTATKQWRPPQEELQAAQKEGALPASEYTVGSEAYAAEYLRRCFGKRLRYICDMKQWFRFDSKVWRMDVGGDCRESVKSLHPQIQRDIAFLSGDNRAALDKLSAKVQTDAGINSIVNMSKTLPGLRNEAVELDGAKTRNLLSCESGIIDLVQGALIKHDPDLLITHHIPYKVDFERDPVKFLQFVRSMFKNQAVAEWMIDYLGYCLTGDNTLQKIICWIGAAGSGKSQLQILMRALMGDFCGDIDADSLVSSKERRAGADSDLASARGKRLLFTSEMPAGRKLEERVFKCLTGGDPLKVKFMGKDKFPLKADAKLVLTANSPPNFSDDPGIARRLLRVQFEIVFSETKDEVDQIALKLLADEGPQILGYLALRAAKHYANPVAIKVLPEKIVQDTKDWLDELDPGITWLNKCTEYYERYHETTDKLLDSFERFCKENDYEKADINPHTIARALRRFGCFPGKNSLDQRGWVNLRLIA